MVNLKFNMSKKSKDQDSVVHASDSSSRKITSFEERSSHIFASIDKLEKLKPQSSLYQEKALPASQSLHAASSSTKHDTEGFRNRESIFKLSEHEETGWPPPNKLKPNTSQWERGRDQDKDFGNKSNRHSFKRPLNRGRIPDHTKNPSKYTKYSLSDAPNVSDRSNTQAALSFLKELGDRKAKMQESKETPHENPSKIMFKRPKRSVNETNANQNNDSPCAITQRVLPEAVVGRSSSFKTFHKRELKHAKNESREINSDKEEHKSGKKSAKIQTLSHLMYEDEDC